MNSKLHPQILKNGRKGFSSQPPRAADPSYSKSADAELAHTRSRFALTELVFSWPSLESIKKSARSEWTISSLKARIAELKSEHRQQLAKAIRFQSHEDRQLYEDEYQTFDELESWTADYIENMKAFYRMERRLRMHQSDDFISRLRYTHILTLLPLYEQLQKCLASEESAKVQRARLFPKSSQSWREMDTRDAKLKVARFLMLDKTQQDDILAREPVWREGKVDVDTVILEYKSNVMFSHEVKNFVKESQTTDPRRRAT